MGGEGGSWWLKGVMVGEGGLMVGEGGDGG